MNKVYLRGVNHQERGLCVVEKEFVTVLIPTSPTPFTGFVIMVPKEQTIDLDMTIEKALRFIVSGGVIAPGLEWKAKTPPLGESEGEQ